MRIRVSQELRQPVGTEFELALEHHNLLLDDQSATADVDGSARLLRTDRGLLVAVHARSGVRGVCSRCLAPVTSPTRIDFEEEFIPVVDPLSGRHITAAEAEESFVIGSELVLDLDEALRQYALMSSPSKPLCRPDCRGLCTTCGANLNEGRCSCPPEGDSRWQVLAALKTREKEGS